MGNIISRIFGREDQFERASEIANKIYKKLQLDGISESAKQIKISLFIDAMKHLGGDEIELDTTIKLLGGRLMITAEKEKAKIKNRSDSFAN